METVMPSSAKQRLKLMHAATVNWCKNTKKCNYIKVYVFICKSTLLDCIKYHSNITRNTSVL